MEDTVQGTPHYSVNTKSRFRSDSTSVQNAIDDPRLSLSLTDFGGNDTNRAGAARLLFEKKVRRYMYQLTVGCQIDNCTQSLCASNPNAVVFSVEVAAAMAVQLASNPKSLLCPRVDPLAVGSPCNDLPHTTAGHIRSNSNNLSFSIPTITRVRSISDVSNFAQTGTGISRNNSSVSSINLKHSRSNSSLNNQHFLELVTSIPKPFLHSLLSYPSFSSVFNDKSNAPPSFSVTEALNPLHPSRSRSLSIMNILLPADDCPLSPDSDISSGIESLIPPVQIADTANTPLIPAAPKESIGLNHLTFDLLQIAVSQYAAERSRDPTFLVNTIERVFSSIDALALSFLTHENSKFQHPSDLDLDSVKSSFNIIMDLEPSAVFQKPLVLALEKTLVRLYMYIRQNQNPQKSILRILFFFLQVPILQDFNTHEPLLKRLFAIFAKLRSKSSTVLVGWCSLIDAEYFISILKISKAFIAVKGPQLSVIPESSFIGAVKVMSILCHANEILKTPVVDLSEFYLNEFSAQLNFKDEYRRWRKSHETKDVNEFAIFNYPFLFDPVAKTRIMHIDAMVKMSVEYEEACVNHALLMHAQRFFEDSETMRKFEMGMKEWVNPYLVLEIRRNFLIPDVLKQIPDKFSDLKKPLKIKFVGGGEEGMDQGGVQKEFFQVLMNDMLDPVFGMFEYDIDTRFCWINRASLEDASQFEIVGIMFGLALYNGVIIRVSFPPLFYKKLLKEAITLADIELAFPALGRGLRQLLEWNEGDVSDIFMRTFEISYERFGKIEHIPLIPGGSEIFVSNENRQQYVALFIEHLTYTSVQNQFQAFQKGFYRVCGGKALQMCRPAELELMICGKATDDDEFIRLEGGAAYDDGYSASHPVIRWFWEIVHAMDLRSKRLLLEFVTASDRIPLKGLGSLVFVIQRNGPDTDRLPSALTCFGRLLLPEYSSKENLKERLLTAIENAKGFGLV